MRCLHFKVYIIQPIHIDIHIKYHEHVLNVFLQDINGFPKVPGYLNILLTLLEWLKIHLLMSLGKCDRIFFFVCGGQVLILSFQTKIKTEHNP